MKKKLTQIKILESACLIFAEKGFRDTTIQDICNHAEANVAAVNYYFGSKSKLYHEVWTYAAKLEEEKHGFDLSNKNDSETWIRENIRNRVMAIFDTGPGGYLCELISKEMANPTPIGIDLRSEFLLPRKTKLGQIVKEMLGPKATEENVQYCSINVLSLFAFLNIGKRANNRFPGHENPTKKYAEEIAKQTVAFALAGIHGVSRTIEEGK